MTLDPSSKSEEDIALPKYPAPPMISEFFLFKEKSSFTDLDLFLLILIQYIKLMLVKLDLIH